MSVRNVFCASFALLSVIVFATLTAKGADFDVILRDGTVYDGSGNPP